MSWTTRLLADVTPLRESRPFRRLWAGSILSSTGSAMTRYAVLLQVYEITHSTLATGGLGLAIVIPMLSVGLLGGSLADGTDRRRLVLAVSSLTALVSAALAAQAFAGLRLVWLLYGLVAVQSALNSVSTPAVRTFIPALMPARQVPAALALSRISFQITLIAGPALAGLITAAPGLGLRACYLVDAVSFTAALYAVARLPAMRPARAGAGTTGAVRRTPRAVAEGLRFIRTSQPLGGAFLADLAATVLGLPLSLFPAINAERFGGDPRTLGLFTTAIGAGGLASAALSGPLTRATRQGRAMLIAVAVWGAAFAGFAVVPWLWLTLALLAVAGAADSVTGVVRGTILQAVTPDELRGRVNAADYVVGGGGGQLGSLEAGALGELTSPVISAVAGGLATVACVIIIALALPAFARYRTRPPPPGAPVPEVPEPRPTPEPAPEAASAAAGRAGDAGAGGGGVDDA